MSISFENIESYDNPNSGRDKINNNFNLLSGVTTDNSGATITFSASTLSAGTFFSQGAFVKNIVKVDSSSYDSLDSDHVLFVVTSANTVTIVMPSNPNTGREIEVKDISYSAGTNIITMTGYSGNQFFYTGGVNNSDEIAEGGGYKVYTWDGNYWQLKYKATE